MNNFSLIDSELQKKVLMRVIELSWMGFGYKKIIEAISKEFSVKLSKGNLSYWFNNNVSMYGGANSFEAKPSKELAYILGVMFGDGSLHFDKKKKDYVIVLSAIDRDFVEKFSRCTSKLLGKKKQYSVCSMDGRGHSMMYSSRARSKELFYFIKELKEYFKKVKPFAEAYPKEFIQGLADSEGCPIINATNRFYVGAMVACSTNKYLLDYVQNLLRNSFEIESKVFLDKKAGITDSVINGRPITRRINLHKLVSRGVNNTKSFYDLIGFSIERKQVKLGAGLEIWACFKSFERVKKWNELYYKNKSKKWVRKSSKSIFDN